MKNNRVEITLLTTTKSGILSFIMVKCGPLGLMYRRNLTEKVSDSESRLIVTFKGTLDCEEDYLVKILEENAEILAVENISINDSGAKTSSLSRQESSDSTNAATENKQDNAENSAKTLKSSDKVTTDSIKIAEEILLGFVGPVASILVASAAKTSKRNGDFFLILARELNGQEREEFLSLVQSRLIEDSHSQ